MLISNINGGTAQRLTSDGAPVAAAPEQAVPVQAAPTQAATTKAAPTPEQAQAAVDNINRVLKKGDSGLEFSVDKQTNRTVFKLVETQTGEVIRQYPTEDLLAIARAIDQMEQQAKHQGLLLSQKA